MSSQSIRAGPAFTTFPRVPASLPTTTETDFPGGSLWCENLPLPARDAGSRRRAENEMGRSPPATRKPRAFDR